MSPGRPIDDDLIRRLERHETECHALPSREIVDLGDALVLFDTLDRDPFFNRLSGPRWPDDSVAFDRRLAEIIALFAIRDRLPHVWPSLGTNQPVDIVARLEGHGFRDIGGGHLMVLDDPDLARPPAPAEIPAGTTLTTMSAGRPATRANLRAFVEVSAAAFDAAGEVVDVLVEEALPSLDDPQVVRVLARVDDEPAAVCKVTTFDGLMYISTVGTAAPYRGRGLAGLATRAAIAASGGPGAGLPYLGVHSHNTPALTVYRRLGFVALGEAPDLLLA